MALSTLKIAFLNLIIIFSIYFLLFIKENIHIYSEMSFLNCSLILVLYPVKIQLLIFKIVLIDRKRFHNYSFKFKNIHNRS